MIHRLVVIDRAKSIGVSLYDNGEIKLQPDLLIGLVQALMLLGEELGPTKGSLREAELGKFQLGILSKDHISYVIVQDSWDSEPFTSKILESVIENYHDTFLLTNFNEKIDNEYAIRSHIADLLTTMKFPLEKLDEVESVILEFDYQVKSIADTIMLSDLDDGVVKIFRSPTDDSIIKVLMEILSEIPFERHWIGQSKLRFPRYVSGVKRTHEAWFIYRVGMTDFCVMGRACYNQNHERDDLVEALDELTDKISAIIFSTPEL